MGTSLVILGVHCYVLLPGSTTPIPLGLSPPNHQPTTIHSLSGNAAAFAAPEIFKTLKARVESSGGQIVTDYSARKESQRNGFTLRQNVATEHHYKLSF